LATAVLSMAGLEPSRQPFVAAAGSGDLEARGARPVDQVADQRRLIAIGQAVDHARLGGALGEQRAAEGVGLDRHHDHALAVAEGLERVLDGGDRIAGRFDDDVDLGMADEGAPIVGRHCADLTSCRLFSCTWPACGS
jgi:hypothetical protein